MQPDCCTVVLLVVLKCSCTYQPTKQIDSVQLPNSKNRNAFTKNNVNLYELT